jgi:hypothetical protein
MNKNLAAFSVHYCSDIAGRLPVTWQVKPVVSTGAEKEKSRMMILFRKEGDK